MRHTLAIVIVNYRTADLTIDCLTSLEPEVAALTGVAVIVVDNASGDGSVERIGRTIDERGWSAWVRLSPSPANVGFAAGNNAAIRGIDAELYMLLNPDTLVKPGAIVELVRFMSSTPRAGIVGGGLLAPDGSIQRASHRFPHPIAELSRGARFGPIDRMLTRLIDPPGEPTEPQLTDWVSGASMMIRRSVIDQIGMMDPAYFLYWDDVDICHRAKRAGWEVWYTPRSRVVHIEGAATGIGQRKRRPHWWYDSRRKYFVRAYGIGGLLLGDMMWAIGRASLLVRRVLRLGGHTDGDPRWFTWDLVMGDLASLFDGRAWAARRDTVERKP